MPIRVFLAWQEIGDGRKQARRWSPDLGGEFLGYERLKSGCLAWLTANGSPKWPDCLSAPLPGQPYALLEEEQARGSAS